ncbi:MAG: nicotinamide mononucleotide adenylyltransferase [Streblomastix strix]|uniref:Nicotinamide-nucleotide adenylyltransferase n=1 Tax=Streblomastix strix TaxID=222440 RepID=A0A5J4V572_9EUKA|nr:MAG: nicotinamide mononucleotide adenylyltransferase [Streblomastix strix]
MADFAWVKPPPPGKRPAAVFFSGSFNPPTNQHFRVLEIAKRTIEKQFGYSVVAGIMSPVSEKYGKKGLLLSNHRVEMCRLGSIGSGWIGVDDWESNQDQWVRTAVTLDSVTDRIRAYLHCDDLEMFFVMSSDCLETMTIEGCGDISLFPQLFKHKMICCRRNNINVDKIIDHKYLKDYKNQIIYAYDEPENNISSTFVRELLSKGQSVRYLIPDAVINYIDENKLYLNAK